MLKTSNNGFRKDINGLRAVAVLGVLGFHLCEALAHLGMLPSNLSFFQGGYVGVDIFFVISGFLMTSIIIRGLERGDFSVLSFWKRRAARICPALVFLVIFVLLTGFFLQSPAVYESSARAGLRALVFISNFWYARSSGGYFADSVLDQFFLHTWSLSVEWQFYLLYPLILLLWFKLGKTFLKAKRVYI